MSRFRISFVSDSVKDAMEIYVVIPQKKHICCKESPEIQLGSFQKEYPMMILLHDEASSPEELLNMTCIEYIAEKEGIMIMVPQGVNSFYTNYAARDCADNSAGESGAANIENHFTEMCYGTYLMDSIRYIDQVFNVSKIRGIGGIGMGGFGALKIAAQYPDMFKKVFSISGDVDLQWKMNHEPDRKEQFTTIFGSSEVDGENDLPGCYEKLADQEKKPEIYLICNENDNKYEMNKIFVNHVQTKYKEMRVENVNMSDTWEYINLCLKKIVNWF